VWILDSVICQPVARHTPLETLTLFVRRPVRLWSVQQTKSKYGTTNVWG
jgi:hypothetical protein